MEQRYGVKRGAIGAILEGLLEALQAPREVDSLACLVIVTGEGLVIPLAPILDKLDIYLGVKAPHKQIEIGFRPSALRKVL
jgi:hypothetical protein